MTEEGGTIYVAMSSDQPGRKTSSLPGAVNGAQTAHEPSPQSNQVDPTDLNGFSLHHEHDDLNGDGAVPGLLETSQFPDFTFPFPELTEEGQMMSLDDHTADLFASPDPSSNPSVEEKKGSTTASRQDASSSVAQSGSKRPHSTDESEDGSQASPQDGPNSLEDNMSDDFGLSATAPGDGTELGGKLKENKTDPTPAWSELKTKAGKERKRLPLACIACRRKKIRCSGEKPACKHCLRSRIPCVYKVTTRKAAPRTDYMAMLDKRLKRMEDRIIKIIPKNEQDTSVSNVVRGVVKPVLPGTLSQNKQQSGKKRVADEAFGAELEHWARGSTRPRLDGSGKPTVTSLQVHEAEESKLLFEGAESLPPKDVQEHLADVFFDNIYGQAYHLLHKPSYIRKLKSV
ncbi:hypothetical protein RRF57_003414 [Xylaria bambusicola]|uniref:Zn(2)-C6 fungal-type domain-containing protein n=1 Tax=Xylaria bambusicola TaxID=326684 RepID=A0AAN7UEQ6_9PEZI